MCTVTECDHSHRQIVTPVAHDPAVLVKAATPAPWEEAGVPNPVYLQNLSDLCPSDRRTLIMMIKALLWKLVPPQRVDIIASDVRVKLRNRAATRRFRTQRDFLIAA